MVKKSGSTKLKRQMAPNFWDIKRKTSRFILDVRAGPYAKGKSYPLGILLRDILHKCNTFNELKIILNSGQIKVDGVIRRDPNFGVGIMDIIEIVPTGESYRLIPKDSTILAPVKTKEKSTKLLKITSKVTIRGNKIQYGFHDGKSLISDVREMKVGDVCLVTLPDLKIENHIKFESGCTALVIKGENAGQISKIEEIKEGLFSLPKRVILTFNDRTVDLPADIVMVIGSDKPMLEVFS